MYSQVPLPLVIYSQIADPPLVSPVTQPDCCIVPCCCYSWTVLCAPQRDNPSAANKSLVALGFPESAPPRVLRSCPYLPVRSLSRSYTMHRHHTPVSRGLVFPRGYDYSPINKIQFFAEPSFESCTHTATCSLDSIRLTEFN